MSDSGDRDLRERFHVLRAEDRARAPAFAATLAAARRRPDRPSPTPWVLVAAAVGVLVLLVTRAGPQAPLPVSLAAGTWRGPTDFLLRLPGEELLSTTPRLGEIPEIGLN